MLVTSAQGQIKQSIHTVFISTPKFLMRQLILILFLFCSLNAFADDVYKLYGNPRFDFSVQYPVGILIPGEEPANGDGLNFYSKDGKAELTVSGIFNAMEWSVDKEFKNDDRTKDNAAAKRVVTYKASKGNWYVVSGIEAGKVFYVRRTLVGDVFKTFSFSYPENEAALYEPILKRMLASHRTKPSR